MSAPRLKIDPIIKDRIADINGDLGRLSASVHVASRILLEAGTLELPPISVTADLLGLTLHDVYDGLMRAMDRLDSMELLPPPIESKPAA